MYKQKRRNCPTPNKQWPYTHDSLFLTAAAEPPVCFLYRELLRRISMPLMAPSQTNASLSPSWNHFRRVVILNTSKCSAKVILSTKCTWSFKKWKIFCLPVLQAEEKRPSNQSINQSINQCIISINQRIIYVRSQQGDVRQWRDRPLTWSLNINHFSMTQSVWLKEELPFCFHLYILLIQTKYVLSWNNRPL